MHKLRLEIQFQDRITRRHFIQSRQQQLIILADAAKIGCFAQGGLHLLCCHVSYVNLRKRINTLM